ncbi:hypothetical protein HID58_068585 [Brassica napus]|uniref:Uncharacterized protein n=1 Tax=Brassica napus TaxID=3708 RepID=A0ABQ7ZLN7_BRANA|nr:hypothetical protein HID58_068585 [Brassica napus]
MIDINRSLQASRRLVSATATAFSFDSSSSFRRTRGARQRIASSKSPASPSPLRNPSDGFNFDVQLTQKAPHLGRRRRRLQRWWSSTLSSRSFLRRRGRKPLARFPSGDWVISEHPVGDNRSGINTSLHRSPGVGKTTLETRVVIVDTSNEIGGDGDVPHSGIGCAKRVQVPNVNLQHDVMIEAVENHMPETI